MKTRHTSTHKICLVLIQSNLLEKLLKEYSISLFTRNWPDPGLTYSERVWSGHETSKHSAPVYCNHVTRLTIYASIKINSTKYGQNVIVLSASSSEVIYHVPYNHRTSVALAIIMIIVTLENLKRRLSNE